MNRTDWLTTQQAYHLLGLKGGQRIPRIERRKFPNGCVGKPPERYRRCDIERIRVLMADPVRLTMNAAARVVAAEVEGRI